MAEDEARKRLHPGQKEAAESDTYGGPKCRSNFFNNDDEATNVMGHTIQITWVEKWGIKNIVDDVLLYGRKSWQLLAYLRTVLDVLKQHRTTLKLKRWKWFQDRCDFLGMDVETYGTQPAQSKNEAFSSYSNQIHRECWESTSFILYNCPMFVFQSHLPPVLFLIHEWIIWCSTLIILTSLFDIPSLFDISSLIDIFLRLSSIYWFVCLQRRENYSKLLYNLFHLYSVY